MENQIKATVYECGNGFPDAGDYVPGDGQLYRIVSLGSRIETGRRSGESNHIPGCVVALADWSDTDSDDDIHSSSLVVD